MIDEFGVEVVGEQCRMEEALLRECDVVFVDPTLRRPDPIVERGRQLATLLASLFDVGQIPSRAIGMKRCSKGWQVK